jgi:hypothetical protein
MPSARFDDDILGPILGRGADDPALLWELLSSVDAVHQTFVDVDELNAALGRLGANELIRELPGHCYVDASSGVGASDPTPITLFEWQAAIEQFRREFERLNAEANQPYPRLTVVQPTATDGPPTDFDIERARDVRDRMTSALSLAGVTVMTAEVTVDGSTVTFWVAGFDEPDPDRMEAAVRPVLLASRVAGSTMTADLWDALADDELPRDFWVIAPTDA